MMTEHTPGLWMLHDMEFATVVTVEKPGKFIALCESKHFTREECERHARLIATLPALLKMLGNTAAALTCALEVMPVGDPLRRKVEVTGSAARELIIVATQGGDDAVNAPSQDGEQATP